MDLSFIYICNVSGNVFNSSNQHFLLCADTQTDEWGSAVLECANAVTALINSTLGCMLLIMFLCVFQNQVEEFMQLKNALNKVPSLRQSEKSTQTTIPRVVPSVSSIQGHLAVQESAVHGKLIQVSCTLAQLED